jgi:hypothetical protein
MGGARLRLGVPARAAPGRLFGELGRCRCTTGYTPAPVPRDAPRNQRNRARPRPRLALTVWGLSAQPLHGHLRRLSVLFGPVAGPDDSSGADAPVSGALDATDSAGVGRRPGPGEAGLGRGEAGTYRRVNWCRRTGSSCHRCPVDKRQPGRSGVCQIAMPAGIAPSLTPAVRESTGLAAQARRWRRLASPTRVPPSSSRAGQRRRPRFQRRAR